MQTLTNPQADLSKNALELKARANFRIEGYLKIPPVFDLQNPSGPVELVFECVPSKSGSKQKGLPKAEPELIVVWCTPEQFRPLVKKLQKANRRLLVEGFPQLVRDQGGKPYLRVLCERLSCLEPSLFSGFINPVTVTWLLVTGIIAVLRFTAPVLVPIPFILLLAMVALYQAFDLAGLVPGLLAPFFRRVGSILIRFGILLEVIWLALAFATRSPLR